MKIQLAGFLDNSSVNGQGLRSVIFMSGCKHNCPNCHNKEMQNFTYGESVDTDQVVNRVLKNLPILDGVTISGGDPMFSPEPLLELLTKLKSHNINIWIYTGFTYEKLIEKEIYRKILNHTDILVDGLYKEELRDDSCKYYGSSNQRIIDCKQSMSKDEVVLTDIK